MAVDSDLVSQITDAQEQAAAQQGSALTDKQKMAIALPYLQKDMAGIDTSKLLGQPPLPDGYKNAPAMSQDELDASAINQRAMDTSPMSPQPPSTLTGSAFDFPPGTVNQGGVLSNLNNRDVPLPPEMQAAADAQDKKTAMLAGGLGAATALGGTQAALSSLPVLGGLGIAGNAANEIYQASQNPNSKLAAAIKDNLRGGVENAPIDYSKLPAANASSAEAGKILGQDILPGTGQNADKQTGSTGVTDLASTILSAITGGNKTPAATNVGGGILGGIGGDIANVLGLGTQAVSGVKQAIAPILSSPWAKVAGAIAGASDKGQAAQLISALAGGQSNGNNLVQLPTDYLRNEPQPLADIDRQAYDIMNTPAPLRTPGQEAFLNSYGTNREQIAASSLKQAPIFSPLMPPELQTAAVHAIEGLGMINGKGGVMEQIDTAVKSQDQALILAAMKKLDDVGQRALGARALSVNGAEALGSLEAIMGPGQTLPVVGQALTPVQAERLRNPDTWVTLKNTARALNSDLLSNVGTLQKTYGHMEGVLGKNGLSVDSSGNVSIAPLTAAETGQTPEGLTTINPADTRSQQKLDKADIDSSYIASLINAAQTNGNVGGKLDAIAKAFPTIAAGLSKLGWKSGSQTATKEQINKAIDDYYALQASNQVKEQSASDSKIANDKHDASVNALAAAQSELAKNPNDATLQANVSKAAAQAASDAKAAINAPPAPPAKKAKKSTAPPNWTP